MGNWTFPPAQKCLCCFSLQNGAKLCGWLFLVGHMMFSLDESLSSMFYYFNCDYYEDPVTGSRECPDWMYNELLIRAIVQVTLVVLQIGSAFLLLLGVYQKIPRFVYQWIILQVSMLAIDILFRIVVKCFFSVQDHIHILEYIIIIPWTCAELYCVYIVFSYYTTMSSVPQMIV